MTRNRLPASEARATIAAVLGLFLFAGLAQANAGTPLMWAGFGHLVIGNAIIGIIEGCILAARFHGRIWRTIGTMVLGNYIAWWVCGLILPLIGPATIAILGPEALLHLRAAVAAGLVLAFGLSLALEAPFSYFCTGVRCLKPGARSPSRKRFLRAHVVAQVVTYAMLVGWYSYASETSLLRVAVRQEMLSRMPEGWVHFTDLDGRPARVRLTGGPVEHDCEWPAGLEQHSANVAASLDPSSPWKVFAGMWAAEGISAEHEDGTTIRVAMETPVISWVSLYPTLVPGSNVVYELGDQIVVFNLDRKVIARLAGGKSPHVVIGP
jgi:hypothetical protein